jgi:DUF4097 and DUF4098 domain-containing protein YvlB
MLSRSKQVKLIGGGLAMLLLSWAGPAASAPRLVEQNIAVEKNAHIAIRNASGQVVVRSWDRPQVHLIWTPSASGIDLDIEQLPASGAADRIRLTTEAGNGHMTNVQGPADLTVEVPPSASLDIRNPEGSVLVRGLQGAVSIATVGGTISVLETAEHLSVSSLSGDIGIIRASGRVEATSISGTLRFVLPTSLHIRGNTTSGAISYEGDLLPGADYDLSTYSGDIDILCPVSASFELRANTVKGKVVPDRRLALTTKRRAPSFPYKGTSLFATQNAGSATVEARSYSGSIRIRGQ